MKQNVVNTEGTVVKKYLEAKIQKNNRKNDFRFQWQKIAKFHW